MATKTQLKTAIDRFVDVTEVRARQIVNGNDTATVTTDNGVIPTFAKAIKDFLDTNLQRLQDLENFDANNTIHNHQAQSLTMARKKQAAENLGYTAYLNVAAANAAMAEIGQPYFDETLEQIRNTTDSI